MKRVKGILGGAFLERAFDGAFRLQCVCGHSVWIRLDSPGLAEVTAVRITSCEQIVCSSLVRHEQI